MEYRASLQIVAQTFELAQLILVGMPPDSEAFSPQFTRQNRNNLTNQLAAHRRALDRWHSNTGVS
jgi:hypothetical protein